MPLVAYVMGCGRSGSTVLDTLLGSNRRAVSTGELSHLVRDGWMGSEVCACGLAVAGCPQWTMVRRKFISQFGEEAPGEYARLQRSVERLRRAPGLILPAIRRPARLERYGELSRGLLNAITSATGRDVVIDSSKNPVRALALSRAGVDLALIHLVRDPRAVAWSFAKSFTRNPAAGVQRDRSGTAAWRTALKWQFVNAQAQLVRRHVSKNRSLAVRYEDLMTSPGAELVRIGQLLNLDFEEVGAAAEAGLPVEIGHPVAGNRLRMSGAVHLRRDEEWRTAMPAHDRLLVTVLAQPSSVAYGY